MLTNVLSNSKTNSMKKLQDLGNRGWNKDF